MPNPDDAALEAEVQRLGADIAAFDAGEQPFTDRRITGRHLVDVCGVLEALERARAAERALAEEVKRLQERERGLREALRYLLIDKPNDWHWFVPKCGCYGCHRFPQIKTTLAGEHAALLAEAPAAKEGGDAIPR